MSPAVIIASELPGADGGLAAAAALAIALAEPGRFRPETAGVVLVEVGSDRPRGPTMLASVAARRLEDELAAAGVEAAARGRLTWVALAGGEGWCERAGAAVAASAGARAVIVHAAPGLLRAAVSSAELHPSGVVLRAELPRQRSLAALAVAELGGRGLAVRIVAEAPGRVATKRALAGIDPGGVTGRRAARCAMRIVPERGAGLRPGRPTGDALAAGERGQALPLVLGAVLVLVAAALALAALGGAVSGKSRAQRLADLAALSAARSMRDDFDRLFVPVRLPSGALNPRHLAKPAYLERARAAATEAVERNEADSSRIAVGFPDRASFAPLRVRVDLRAALDLGSGSEDDDDVAVHAVAEAAPPPSGATAGTDPAPATASGGGYSGPLVYRQGEGIRPDVAAAFDRLAAAARRDGLALIVNSGFRSDAEQAALFAQNPDPQWVAPPGTSLHRCATELDLGPPSAYGWLAANAPRFGFLRRYSWEPWHYGYTRGPAPCSAAGNQVGVATSGGGGGSADGGFAAGSLPAYVPARFRAAIARAASRWNVSATLLAAQLMAESNFNPFAVSPAGAQGIAQFMPATAADYGLDDPFDAAAAIDAQAHLMSDLLAQFGSVPLALAAYNAGPAAVAACDCVPAYPETQAYVARILGLMDGAGELVAPTLEVRLVS